jgi:hypothetical protein
VRITARRASAGRQAWSLSFIYFMTKSNHVGGDRSAGDTGMTKVTRV